MLVEESLRGGFLSGSIQVADGVTEGLVGLDVTLVSES